MSKDINQIFIAQPITSNISTDLMYFGRSPYGATDDKAMTFSNFSSQFPASVQVQQSVFNYAVDTGVANNYVANLTPAPAVLTDGLTIYLKVANANNSQNCTLDLNGLGPTPITQPSGMGLGSQDMSPAFIAVLTYNTFNNSWELQNPTLSVASPYLVTTGQFDVSSDSGAVNAYIGTAPFFTTISLNLGTRVFFFPGNTNTGAATFTYSSTPTAPIIYNGTPLVGGEMIASQLSILVWDNTSWQLANSYLSGGGGSVTPQDLQNNTFTYTANTGGTGNDYTATMTPPLASLVDGQRISMLAPMTNTNNSTTSAPATLDVDGLGPKNIFIHTAVLSSGLPALAGAIQSGLIYDFTYNSSADHWFVENPSTMVTGEFMVRQYWCYAVDAGAVNAYDITIPTIDLDLFGDPNPGARVVFTTANPNSGASTLVINAGNVRPIVSQNGSALIGGEITSTSVNEFTYFNNAWVLTNPATSSLGGPFYEGVGGVNSAHTIDAFANGANSFAIGLNANANASDAIAMAAGSAATANSTIAIGNGTTANANNAVAISQSAQAYGFGAVSLGLQTTAPGAHAYCFSFNGYSGGDNSYTLGNQATTNNAGSVVWGDSTVIPVQDSMADQFNLTFAGGFRFFLNNVPTPSWAIDPVGNAINSLGTADQSKSVQVPTTGFSITISDTSKTLILAPAGALLAGTVVMPANPVDGQEVRISTTQTITTLTVNANAGQTISNSPTTIGLGTGFSYIYDLPGTNWYRLY